MIKEQPVDTEKKSNVIHVNPASTAGPIWFIGWLFTIAFAKLIWWQAILGLIIWPYYLGLAVK